MCHRLGILLGFVMSMSVGFDTRSITTTDCQGPVGGTCVMSCDGTGLGSAGVAACWYKGHVDFRTLLFCITEIDSSTVRLYNMDPSYRNRVWPDLKRISRDEVNLTIHFKNLRPTDSNVYLCVFQNPPNVTGSVRLTVLTAAMRSTMGPKTPSPPPSVPVSPTLGVRDVDESLPTAQIQSASWSLPLGLLLTLLILLGLAVAVWWWFRRRNSGRPDVRQFRVLRLFRA